MVGAAVPLSSFSTGFAPKVKLDDVGAVVDAAAVVVPNVKPALAPEAGAVPEGAADIPNENDDDDDDDEEEEDDDDDDDDEAVAPGRSASHETHFGFPLSFSTRHTSHRTLLPLFFFAHSELKPPVAPAGLGSGLDSGSFFNSSSGKAVAGCWDRLDRRLSSRFLAALNSGEKM